LGWPNETADLARYYPTTTLVTGFDIIFFWVARMTMMAGHFTGTMPFKDVYIHGLVRDENNKKMSKSANNGIDPLILIDKYGTDALRYALIREVTGAGQDIRLEYNRKTDESVSVEASRNFTNKLWNASRFVMMNLDGQSPAALGMPEPNSLELSDRWILSRFHQITQTVRNSIDRYGMGEAAKSLYEFIWGDFCDWYIELVKSRLQGENAESRRTAQQTLAYVLEGTLKLLHPFMPHITEEIWHTLTQTSDASGQALAIQLYPVPDASLINPEIEQQFDLIIEAIRTIRNLRAEAEIKPGARIETILQTESDRERHILVAGQPYIKDLAKVQTLTIAGEQSPELPSLSPTAAVFQDAQSVLEIGLDAVGNFINKHQRAILSLGLIVFTLISIKVLGEMLESIHQVPLLAPFFEVVGIVCSVWFVRTRLWSVPDRQHLFEQAKQLKDEVVGTPGNPAAQPLTPSVTSAIAAPADEPGQTIVGVVGTTQVTIPLAGLIDLAALRAKAEKDLKKVDGEIQALRGRLSNPKFVDKAPPDVVEAARRDLAEAETQAEILRAKLDRL
jgi:valyl-tRNA synthetase